MKKGFTLIELLAVIIILAIIALIATPIILNIINDAREEANERSIELYLDAVELAIAKENLKLDFKLSTCEVKSDGTGDLLCGDKTIKVDVNGSVPIGGMIKFENGKIVSFKNIKINEVYARLGENNTILFSNEPVVGSVCIPTDKETVTTGNIPKGNYENGDEYICEVKNGVFYHFFIVSTNANGEVNLIADRNMTEQGPATPDNLGAPAWASVEDYYSGLYPKIEKECKADSSHTCYNAGPITALNQLDKVVSGWTNIPLKDYVTNEYAVVANDTSNGTEIGTWRYITDAGWPPYNSITRNTRARLLTVQEASDNGCMFEYDDAEGKRFLGTCPLYMVNYTKFKDSNATSGTKFNGKIKVDGVRGYWTSSSMVGYGSTGHCAIGIHDNAVLNCKYTSESGYYGIRPVITLTKKDLGGKVCTYIDEDNSGTINLSDVVTCGSESFYVMENDGSNITMLTKYNLDVGNIFDFNTYTVTAIENPTGIQSSKTLDFSGSTEYYGTLDFSTTNYWNASTNRYPAYVYGDYKDANGNQQNIIYKHVSKYKTYLKEQLGLDVANATLMSYEQVTDLINNKGNPSWLYNTTYWIGTAENGGLVWGVSSNGSFYATGYNFYFAGGLYRGVRPLITIPISNIK